jgi:hypothetical protein
MWRQRADILDDAREMPPRWRSAGLSIGDGRLRYARNRLIEWPRKISTDKPSQCMIRGDIEALDVGKAAMFKVLIDSIRHDRV